MGEMSFVGRACENGDQIPKCFICAIAAIKKIRNNLTVMQRRNQRSWAFKYFYFTHLSGGKCDQWI